MSTGLSRGWGVATGMSKKIKVLEKYFKHPIKNVFRFYFTVRPVDTSPRGGYLLKSIESSVWCVGRTWFDVRRILLILENVLHTHNMYYRPIENFLDASEVQKIMKNSIFYNIFGTYKLPLERVSNYKNYHPFAFSSKKIFSCMISVQKCFQSIL